MTTTDRCLTHYKFGWFCNRLASPSGFHSGHPLWWPRWWNFSAEARAFRRKRHL